MTISTYHLTTPYGKHIRIATQVEIGGRVIQFAELLTPSEAQRQAVMQVAMEKGATIEQAQHLAGFLER